MGALDLPATLLAGPESVLGLIHGRDPMEQPYSEDRAEGGSLVDADRRILRFYTRQGPVRESVGLRRAFMPLLAERWPG